MYLPIYILYIPIPLSVQSLPALILDPEHYAVLCFPQPLVIRFSKGSVNRLIVVFSKAATAEENLRSKTLKICEIYGEGKSSGSNIPHQHLLIGVRLISISFAACN